MNLLFLGMEWTQLPREDDNGKLMVHTFFLQLAVNGRKLYDCQPGELEELMLRVRTTLMSRNLSGQCRCWLLLALDLATNRYAPLSGQLQAFYQVCAFL